MHPETVAISSGGKFSALFYNFPVFDFSQTALVITGLSHTLHRLICTLKFSSPFDVSEATEAVNAQVSAGITGGQER